MTGKQRGLGDTYTALTGLRKTREWRGVRDTLYDFRWWLTTWKDMIAFVMKSPVRHISPFPPSLTVSLRATVEFSFAPGGCCMT